jgi:uncharacterized membrane protein YoaT (DUF817 family)
MNVLKYGREAIKMPNNFYGFFLAAVFCLNYFAHLKEYEYKELFFMIIVCIFSVTYLIFTPILNSSKRNK